jgi:protein-disulfide isomerase
MKTLPLILIFSACAGLLSACAAEKPQVKNVATINGLAVTEKELDDSASRQLFEVRSNALDQLITDRVLENAAKAEHLSPDAYLKREIEKRVPIATSAEAKDFYEKNKDNLPAELASKSWEELEPQLIQALTGERRKHAAVDLVEELKKQQHVQVLLAAPRVEVAAAGPARGAANAKITIVEFSDFQCPFCARAQPAIDQVLKQYPDKVRIVYRDFPLSFHSNAARAAEAGHCANDQEKFWPLHDWIFTHQNELGEQELSNAAKDLGLDQKKFDACMVSHKYQQAVVDNQAAGEKAGVTGTPAFFVDGELLSGAQPFEKFQEVIERHLAH